MVVFAINAISVVSLRGFGQRFRPPERAIPVLISALPVGPLWGERQRIIAVTSAKHCPGSVMDLAVMFIPDDFTAAGCSRRNTRHRKGSIKDYG